MLLGAATMVAPDPRLCPDAEIVGRERFSRLTYDGPRKAGRLPRHQPLSSAFSRKGMLLMS